jgi:hypothetical protein
MSRTSPRELTYAGLFGAAALLLPVLFHLVHLGRLFLPMYLPLLVLAFLVRPAPAAVTAALTPLLSAAATGMPPWVPPVAPIMAIELAIMVGLLSFTATRWPRANEWLLLAAALLLGRTISIGLTYGYSLMMGLPAKALAQVSFFVAWPGMVLNLVTVPPIVRIARRSRRQPVTQESPP